MFAVELPPVTEDDVVEQVIGDAGERTVRVGGNAGRDVDADGLGVQLLLRAEVAGDQRRIDAYVAGDLADAGPVEALAGEAEPGGLEEGVTGGRAVAAAGRIGAAERAVFVRADLSTVAGMNKAVGDVGAVTGAVDGLVFGAQRFRPRREETEDGLEFTFALAYLSRYVLGHGLVEALERAEAPVIMNIAGSGGLPGKIHWDDPQLRDKYRGMRAAMQASRCNDLLGVAFPERHPDARTRYVLYNPGFVRTGMADPLPGPQRILTEALGRVFAQPVSKAVVPIARLLDEPPAGPVTAFMRGKPLTLTGENFDADRARRLDKVTAELAVY